jgi:serine/threonine protein phosphatase PrpC
VELGDAVSASGEPVARGETGPVAEPLPSPEDGALQETLGAQAPQEPAERGPAASAVAPNGDASAAVPSPDAPALGPATPPDGAPAPAAASGADPEAVAEAPAAPADALDSVGDAEADAATTKETAAAPGTEPPAPAQWNTPVPGGAPESAEVRASAPDRATVEAVSFTPEAGAYHPPLTVVLSCATANAAIHYTQDGSEPVAGSPRYTPGDPLFLPKSATIRARAFLEGAEPGPATEAVYELRAPQWLEREPEDRSDAVEHRVDSYEELPTGWKVACASRRGKLHAHHGTYREDSYATAYSAPWSILAVSDGAGSASLSRVGSRIACERAVAELQARLPSLPPAAEDVDELRLELRPMRTRLANAARAALNGIREVAAERNQPADDFAATLLVAAHCRWQDQDLVVSIQVGDGQIALLDQDGTCVLLGEADHGEHSSETRFLTTRGVEDSLDHRFKAAIRGELRAIALMTDGVSDDFFPEKKRMKEIFGSDPIPGKVARDGGPQLGLFPRMDDASSPSEALADWLEYERKASSDDRTLILYWRGTA